ncbi:MAG TPA: endonuclease III domain-containing protein [Gammaproteobacteria bacterium]|nr:endonuclease III domain-containing protein [Gammaproteobacteria bacterium]
MSKKNRFVYIYELLDTHHGPQNWWPADTPFEVMVGAVLVQNTTWRNASAAITCLKNARLMSPSAIRNTPIYDLADFIVSSGYFNIKAQRLMALCEWLEESGGIDQIQRQSLKALRRNLLSVHGIGPETADDILLYAFDRPVFVIDSYTRRLFSRLGLIRREADYESLRGCFEKALERDMGVFNQYHALIVVHAKGTCKKQPRCEACCLAVLCDGVQKNIL